jgi:chromosomal replication initiator protein
MNTTHTFDNFINGKSNQFVCNVANFIAKSKSIKYNPILFYGSNGVGKTHLLESLHIVLKEQGKKVIFTSISEFEKDYVHSLKKQTIEQFEWIHRDCDVLLIDDIQHLSNKGQIQEEFWKIFNTLYKNNKQIVFTSLKEPHALTELMHNVQNKFNWGLAAKIEPLEDKTKIKIIDAKLQNI